MSTFGRRCIAQEALPGASKSKLERSSVGQTKEAPPHLRDAARLRGLLA
jgi:hypothetical protein